MTRLKFVNKNRTFLIAQKAFADCIAQHLDDRRRGPTISGFSSREISACIARVNCGRVTKLKITNRDACGDGSVDRIN